MNAITKPAQPVEGADDLKPISARSAVFRAELNLSSAIAGLEVSLHPPSPFLMGQLHSAAALLRQVLAAQRGVS